MKKIELLAPAGSIDSLYAAVQNGADAVYLGGNKFSARAYASNFDEETMMKAVEYCHVYGVKVYITINTLIKEEEIQEAIDYVGFLYSIGIDALIVQDLGLSALIKENYPDFELHASTQMTIHNTHGAKLLKEAGFSRIVLSRELSLKEIEQISSNKDLETEIFIHGALCICYSGQCLMSSLIGGRSGNRGKCAQPCRLPYTLVDQNGKETSAYLLSPKDICTIEDIENLINSGTASLKIEGRMKRPEYVAGVVRAYREAIDSIYEKRNFEANHQKQVLLKLFNREGFSKAYIYGNEGKDMMAYNFPKNTGTLLGKVNKDLSIILEDDLALKDGIRFGEEGFILSNIIKDGKDAAEALKGEIVKLVPSPFKAFDILYKTSDVTLLNALGNSYKNPYLRKINLDAEIIFKPDAPFEMKTQYDGEVFKVKGDMVQKAITKPLEYSKLLDNLRKSGDTPFKVENIIALQFEEGFLPVSAINEVRRKLVNQVEEHLKSKYKRNSISSANLVNSFKQKIDKLKTEEIPELLVLISNEAQLKAALDSGVKDIIINPFIRNNNINMENVKNISNVYFRVPNIVKEEFNYVCKYIEDNLDYIKGIVTSNLGIINVFKGRVPILGDYKLNIFNSYGARFYEQFLTSIMPSAELNKGELKHITGKIEGLVQYLVYGRVELMVSEYCPIGSSVGGKCGSNPCNGACDNGSYHLRDRKGEEFIVSTDKFCRSYIYNSAATNLLPNRKELEKLNIKHFRIDFSNETYEEAVNILKAYEEKNWTGDFSKYTRGHFKRGVE